MEPPRHSDLAPEESHNTAREEKTPEEIVVAAQVTALRTLHKLTGMLEEQMVSNVPRIELVAAFRQAVEAVDKMGVDGVPSTVNVFRWNDERRITD